MAMEQNNGHHDSLCTLIESLRSSLQKYDENPEEIVNVRSYVYVLMLKIRSTPQAVGLRVTDIASGIFVVLLQVLQVSRDIETLKSMVQIFQGLSSAKNVKGPFVKAMLHKPHSAVAIFIQFFVNLHTKIKECPMNLFIAHTRILSKIAPYEDKFSLRMRLHGALRVIMHYLRVYSNNIQLLKPMLQLTKYSCKNRINIVVFGREGLICSTSTVYGNYYRTKPGILKVIFDVWRHLIKTQKNSNRLIKAEGLTKMFTLIEHWERIDERNRAKVLKSCVSVLSVFSDRKFTKRAIIQEQGVVKLYTLCRSLPPGDKYGSVISDAVVVIQNLLPRQGLPVSNSRSVYQYINPKIIETSTYKNKLKSMEENDQEEEEDVDEDDDEDEDDILDESYSSGSGGEENEVSKQRMVRSPLPKQVSCPEQENKSCETGSIQPQRDRLSWYGRFYPEISESPRSSRPSSRTQLEYYNGGGKSVSKKKVETPDDVFYRTSKIICPDELLRPGSRLASTTNACFSAGPTLTRTPERLFSYNNTYREYSSRTKSVVPFVKLAYPDLYSNYGKDTQLVEMLHTRNPDVSRRRILDSIDRHINKKTTESKVVYDVKTGSKSTTTLLSQITVEDGDSLSIGSDGSQIQLSNDDTERVGKRDPVNRRLHFESRFEGGNLRKVIQRGPIDYDLILNADVNTNRNVQWFYFEVSNMDARVGYNFHIINCEKQNSQFNAGMKPVMFSVRDAMNGKPGWVRIGTDICYYRNTYHRPKPSGAMDSPNETACNSGATSSEPKRKKRMFHWPQKYYTTSFSVTFANANDVCYIAYHYPYNYTMLQTHIQEWEHSCERRDVYFANQTLAHSLRDNPVPVLTITSLPKPQGFNGNAKKKYVVLTSRVHPGESNSSWVMKGIIDYLTSEREFARQIREKYIFKIVPMLNVDGVINGCHRCNLMGVDLNRCWGSPSELHHPTIFHAKNLIEYLVAQNMTPWLYCDFHGHSRRKNIFIYGCGPSQSWSLSDRCTYDNKKNRILPRLLHFLAPAFSLHNCSFRVEKCREGTARVAVWRMGVQQSYTLESSYCGCDQGPFAERHLGMLQLEEMGHKFCQSLCHLSGLTTGNTTPLLDSILLQISSGTDLDLEMDNEDENSDSDLSGTSSDDEEISLDGSNEGEPLISNEASQNDNQPKSAGKIK